MKITKGLIDQMVNQLLSNPEAEQNILLQMKNCVDLLSPWLKRVW